MNTPISPELSKEINDNASLYASVQYGDPAKMQGLREINAFDNGVEDYIAGATAYAPYKERFEQAKKALEELVFLKDLKDNHGKTPHYEVHQPIAWESAKALLATWKEEGKEGSV